MPFSSAAVANEFLRLSFRDHIPITPLKMQKLVYFAHGWHLAITGKPLLREKIQAWQWGPVIPSLYQQFKECGADSIKFPASIEIMGGDHFPANINRESRSGEEIERATKIIERVWEQYGKFSASDLSTLTHDEGSPWALVPDKEDYGAEIPNDTIKDYFVKQASR
jgi:uncharacterized phage-associated protein